MTIHNQIRGFPNDPFFAQILQQATDWATDWFILDPANNVKVTYAQLLWDAAIFKDSLSNKLSLELYHELQSHEERGYYFFLVAPSGYYFLVGFLAILAVGGAAIPLGQ